jgi:hypothetical protein
MPYFFCSRKGKLYIRGREIGKLHALQLVSDNNLNDVGLKDGYAKLSKRPITWTSGQRLQMELRLYSAF